MTVDAGSDVRSFVPHPSAGIVIAIDGPAGSGKSTTAREVARRLGYRHLDSGALYRALTLALLRRGIPESRWDGLGPEDFEALDVEVEPSESGFTVLLDGEAPGPELRAEETTSRVAHLARNPNARAKLGVLQRTARTFGSLVADGRDMGTVVFPDADLKVYLTASLDERARRRQLQEGRPIDPESVAKEAKIIRRRDRTDQQRDVAPLRKDPDAIEIDTTALAFAAQVDRIITAAQGLTEEPGEE